MLRYRFSKSFTRFICFAISADQRKELKLWADWTSGILCSVKDVGESSISGNKCFFLSSERKATRRRTKTKFIMSRLDYMADKICHIHSARRTLPPFIVSRSIIIHSKHTVRIILQTERRIKWSQHLGLKDISISLMLYRESFVSPFFCMLYLNFLVSASIQHLKVFNIP